MENCCFLPDSLQKVKLRKVKVYLLHSDHEKQSKHLEKFPLIFPFICISYFQSHVLIFCVLIQPSTFLLFLFLL